MKKHARLLIFAALLGLAQTQHLAAQSPKAPKIGNVPREAYWSHRSEPFVEVQAMVPTIVVELRYATARNFTGKPIYPRNARCLLRRTVAERLERAEKELSLKGLGLKVWDAYRPAWAHAVLWNAKPDPDFVAHPSLGSYHTWGAAVDVTLVDRRGREQPMPTDFDDFTPAAKSAYQGTDPVVSANLKTLQDAMKNAGFQGSRDEWWHFTAEDANLFAPVKMPLEKGGKY